MNTAEILLSESLSAEKDPTLRTWRSSLAAETALPYFKEITNFIKQERGLGKEIYPPQDQIFNALKLTPLDSLKVVILGQDPYHGIGQAHGLCFSVQHGITPPPSLKNIYKELNSDLGITIPSHGCLTGWAKQGILLLNTILSVEKSKPASHKNIGWETFTDKVISTASSETDFIVFLLWGAHAHNKRHLIDEKRHLVLAAPHPSPFSAASGFFGCKHFSKTNDALINKGKIPIDWGKLV